MILQKIKDAFGDCKYLATPNCDNCEVKSSYQDVDLPEFYVFDSKEVEPVQLAEKADDYQLAVKNNTEERVVLIKLDNCLLTNETKKCDCVLLNSKKCFFVEIKDSSSGARSSNRRKAVEQLGITIELFKDNEIDISKHDAKAVICFKNSNTRPTQASNNAKKAVFLASYNIDLVEGNEIIFE